MSNVIIRENFYGDDDPLHAGRPYENTLAGQADQARNPEAHPIDEATINDAAVERAKIIVKGLRISLDDHPKEKVLEHTETDIRQDLFEAKNKNGSSNPGIVAR